MTGCVAWLSQTLGLLILSAVAAGIAATWAMLGVAWLRDRGRGE